MMITTAGELEQIKIEHIVAVAKAEKELASQKAIYTSVCFTTQIAMAQFNLGIMTMLNGA